MTLTRYAHTTEGHAHAPSAMLGALLTKPVAGLCAPSDRIAPSRIAPGKPSSFSFTLMVGVTKESEPLRTTPTPET